MANELATAYIQLLPSFRGLRREVERGLKDVEPVAKAAGEKAGKSLREGLVDDSAAGSTAAEFARQGERAGDSFADAALDAVDGQGFERAGRRVGEDLSDGARSAIDGRPLLDADEVVADRTEFTRAGEQAGDSVGDGVRSSLDSARLFDADNLTEGVDFDQAGQRIGEETSEGVSSGLGEIAGSFEEVMSGLPAPAAAAGALAGAVLVAGIGTALERGRLESKFEVTLGASEGTARRLGERAGEIYADNFGQSLEEVGDAVARVQRTFGDELDDDALDEVTEKALTLANFFEEDLNSVVRASSKLISTGLADDAEEAFDIITTGLQGTANEGQDFLDTLNEYSVQFEKLGLDGRDALNLISQGLENGARDSDIVADAFKEFSIRAVEGSAEVEQAFATLNIDDGAERIAAGGETARTALAEVLDALRDVEDPALRAQVAFRLFGTQSEDLGGALLALDLDETVADIEKIPGASDRAVDSVDDLASNFETLKRTIGTELGEGINEFLALPAELLSDERSWAGAGRAAAETFWGAFTLNPVVRILGPKWVEGVVDQLGIENEVGIIEALLGDREQAGDAPEWLVDRLNGVEAGAEGASGELNEYEEAARNAGVSSDIAADGADAIAAALERTAINGDLAAAGIEAAAAGAAAYLEAVENATTADDLALAGVASGSAIRDVLEGAAVEGAEGLRLPAVFDAVAAALGEYSESQEGALSALIEAGEASQGVIAGLLESGNVQGALDAADQIRDKFTDEILPALGITDQAAQDYYLTLLGLDETTVNTAVELSGAEQALQTLGLYSEILQNLGTFSLEDQFTIADLINQGDIEGARALIDAEIEEGRQAVTLNVEADVQPARTTVANWVQEVAERPPVPSKIGGDDSGARSVLDNFQNGVRSSQADTKIGADDQPARSVFEQFQRTVVNAPTLLIDIALQAVGPLADLIGDSGDVAVDVFRALLPGFSTGGLVDGPGTSTSDSILARLSDGEYVMDAATVQAYGVDFFAALQRRQLPGFATGGLVGSTPPPAPAMGGGVAIDYTVVEAKSRPRPEDLVRVTNSAMFLGAL